MELKATVFGHDIIVPKDKEGSSKGAALLAGIGCGIYNDAETAYKMTFKQDRIYKPVKELKETVDKWYCVYYELIEDLKGINKKIQNIYQTRIIRGRHSYERSYCYKPELYLPCINRPDHMYWNDFRFQGTDHKGKQKIDRFIIIE